MQPSGHELVDTLSTLKVYLLNTTLPNKYVEVHMHYLAYLTKKMVRYLCT